MRLLVTKDNVVFDFDDDIVFAKGGAADGGLQECEQSEATHIWNRTRDVACMNNGDITVVDLESIPEEVKPHEYKYVDGEFVINEEYVPYISQEERITMLEEMVNMLLLG